MKRVRLIAVTLICAIFLCACKDQPSQEAPSTTAPQLQGWQISENGTTYILSDGSLAKGWLQLDGSRYYFDNSGKLYTGWLEQAGQRYYLGIDGAAVTGEAVIGGETHHFTAEGRHIYLVNPWNPVPQDYTPDLVKLDNGISSKDIYVDRSCYEALNQMIADCNAQCPKVCVVSGYRTNDYQTGLYNRKVNYYLEQGYSKADAQAAAATVVAIPGTSEHQLGLAVDIIDTRSWSLTEVQETLPAQQWLMENSWRYGFILRYPKDKTEITGIIYEPWHYRYVGVELARELYESGLTLEEYLQIHTKTQP